MKPLSPAASRPTECGLKLHLCLLFFCALAAVIGLLPSPAFAQNSPQVFNALTDLRLPAHPAGNGVTDDLPALTADILYLRHIPSSVLYLPAGTYLMNNSAGKGLVLYSGTYLTGDGPGQTVLIGTGNSNDKGALVSFYKVNGAGLSSLSIINQTPADPPPYARSFANCLSNSQPCSNIAFKNLFWNLGNGGSLILDYTSGVDVENCDFEALAALHGFFSARNCASVTILGSTFHYQQGRFLIGNSSGIVANNAFTMVGGVASPRVSDTGGIEFSFANNLVISGNVIQTLGLIDTTRNDGEALLCQNQFVNRNMAMSNCQTQNVTITGNTLTNNFRGIEFYDGAVNCAVSNNTLVDSDGDHVSRV